MESKPTAREIFERHHLAVFRFLRRACGGGAVAEDLTQDVFLRVLRALDAYRDTGRERSWVFRIAHNVLRDHRSARRAELALVASEAPPEASATIPATQSFRVALDGALRQVPAVEREAFLMREYGGMSYEEIASATEATRDAVRSRIFRARKALTHQLDRPRIRRSAR